MSLRPFDDLGSYSPQGHEGVINRLLVGEALGDGGAVSVWHGVFEPGGRSEVHMHEKSTQVYVCLRGAFVVVLEGEAMALTPLDTLVIPMATSHMIENRSSEPTEVMVISTPALR